MYLFKALINYSRNFEVYLQYCTCIIVLYLVHKLHLISKFLETKICFMRFWENVTFLSKMIPWAKWPNVPPPLEHISALILSYIKQLRFSNPWPKISSLGWKSQGSPESLETHFCMISKWFWAPKIFCPNETIFRQRVKNQSFSELPTTYFCMISKWFWETSFSDPWPK